MPREPRFACDMKKKNKPKPFSLSNKERANMPKDYNMSNNWLFRYPKKKPNAQNK